MEEKEDKKPFCLYLNPRKHSRAKLEAVRIGKTLSSFMMGLVQETKCSTCTKKIKNCSCYDKRLKGG